MKSAGGEPCLSMHGWWKNVSLNGSQLSAALTRAKTSQGNKIWHYHCYYTAIINYPLSLLLSLSFWLSSIDAHVHTHHTHRLAHTHTHIMCTPLIFPWSLGRTWKSKSAKMTNYLQTHTHTAKFDTHWDSCPSVQTLRDDRRMCAL